MADDLKIKRDQYQSDLDDWSEARTERGLDMKCLAGDPWPEAQRNARKNAMRPCLTFDELSQYVNQIVNEVRANPRAVQFAPTGPGTSEEAAQFYADKMREIEYRSHAQLAYTTAFEAAVMGGYGFVRVSSEYMPDSVDRQELVIKPVSDPNTVIPTWNFERPDLSDMRRCWVLEWRPLSDFQKEFPKAKEQSFDGFSTEDAYKGWFREKEILLAEHWEVRQELKKLLLVQPPSVQPPQGQFGLRPASAPPPKTIPADQWAAQPAGTRFLRDRETMVPKVVQQLMNGCEVLKETTWPGPYIPIAGCLGRVLYLDDGGQSKRIIMSAVRLTRDPLLAYCFYRTSEMENVGMTTKNPYWAYRGQVTPEQQQEIVKSMHEPVAILFAEPTVEGTPAGTTLPLPQRNVSEPAIQALSVGAEEARRAIQSGMATNFLPSGQQKQNDRSGKSWEKMQEAAMRGSYHFVDHFEMMLRHVGCIVEAALPVFHDAVGDVLVRKGDDTTALVRLNDPSDEKSIDPKGNYAVTVSSGPSFDSTQEAASVFADGMLEQLPMWMQAFGPQKATKIAALAVKLKVKQTGIGEIGNQIVDIIDPPQKDGQQPDPQQLLAALQQADQMMQQLLQRVKELEGEQAAKEAIEKLRGEFALMKQQLAGDQKVEQITAQGQVDAALQNDEQAHEAALSSADAAEAKEQAQTAMLATVAQSGRETGSGKPNGAAQK
jgi:hypothetical protein